MIFLQEKKYDFFGVRLKQLNIKRKVYHINIIHSFILHHRLRLHHYPAWTLPRRQGSQTRLFLSSTYI